MALATASRETYEKVEQAYAYERSLDEVARAHFVLQFERNEMGTEKDSGYIAW